MSDEDKETQELEQRMRLAMQKAGFIIPSDLDVDEELPAESMRAKIPEELSDIDAAIEQLKELECVKLRLASYQRKYDDAIAYEHEEDIKLERQIEDLKQERDEARHIASYWRNIPLESLKWKHKFPWEK